MANRPKLRDIKLQQEKAYDEKVKLDRMSPRDPRRAEQFDKMQSEAAKCGYAYKEYLQRNGRNIK